MSDSRRFLRRGKDTCRQTPAGGRKCPTKSGGKQSSAATYLTLPNLRGVQEVITDKMNCSLPETLLTLLHRIYPLDEVLKNSDNPVDFLKKSFTCWVKDLMNPEIIERFPLVLQILENHQIDSEIYSDIGRDEIMIHFGFEEFYYEPSIWIDMDHYRQIHPDLPQYILKLLFYCPFPIGIPAMLYEMASEYSWYGDSDEQMIWDERYQEYIDSGESEEEAREYVEEMIILRYTDFADHFPDWTFERHKRDVKNYTGPIPDELKRLHNSFCRFKRGQKHYMFPDRNIPGIVVGIDQDTYDWGVNILETQGNEIANWGASYAVCCLGWNFTFENNWKILAALLEFKNTIQYLNAALEFIMQNRKEAA